MEVSTCESALVSVDDLYSPIHLSNLGAVVYYYNRSSFTAPRRIIIIFFFLECVAFYLLLGWSENCQAPRTWKWKLEVPAYLLNWSLIAQLWELSLDL